MSAILLCEPPKKCCELNNFSIKVREFYRFISVRFTSSVLYSMSPSTGANTFMKTRPETLALM
jgi:hypothetical protein